MRFANFHRTFIADLKCLIVGDVMLDEYVIGSVSRVSPEAPVPVVHVAKKDYSLGGAANVAAGISALGASASLAGALGKDKSAENIHRILKERGIAYGGITSEERGTVKKTRLIGNGSQIARYDEEDIKELSEADETNLIVKIKESIKTADIAVISDYNKGVCTQKVCRAVMESAAEHGIPAIVDPKRSDWARYKGAFLIAPNYSEFTEAVKYLLKGSLGSLTDDARSLIKEYKIEHVLITRSQEGMTLINENETIDFNAIAKEVYDVSGAGDTVVAALSAYVAAGTSLNDAVEIANLAAGIAVGKAGTYAVTLQDIEKEIGGKVISEDSIATTAADWKRQGKKIVFTNGCFDIVHAGHISLLKQAKLFGDILIVGLNTDTSVKRLKGEGRPINCEVDRAIILSAFEAVDAVVLFDEDTPLELIIKIKPEVLVKGADYSADTVVGADIVTSYGGELRLIDLVEDKSTTNTISAIMSNG